MAVAEGLQGIHYAEDQLGVHSVYHDAKLARANLQAVVDEIFSHRRERRVLEQELADREMQLASDEWAKNPDLSAAKMDTHMKIMKNTDPECRRIRDKIFTATDRIEGKETSKLLFEADLKIAVSRLQELGGYLNYLAAIKQAHTASTA